MPDFIYFIFKKIWRIISPASWYLGRYKMQDYSAFDVTQPLGPNAAEVMERCCNAFEKNKIKYLISWGTALGLYRNGEFIPHDTDIDIDIINCENQKFIDNALRGVGMKLARSVFYRNRPQQLIYISEEGVLFDIMFWTSARKFLKGKIFVNYSEPGYIAKMPFRFSENINYIEYKNKKYPSYSPIKEYLAFLYSENWKIPKKSKGDWKEDCLVISKLFSCRISDFLFKKTEFIRKYLKQI